MWYRWLFCMIHTMYSICVICILNAMEQISMIPILIRSMMWYKMIYSSTLTIYQILCNPYPVDIRIMQHVSYSMCILDIDGSILIEISMVLLPWYSRCMLQISFHGIIAMIITSVLYDTDIDGFIVMILMLYDTDTITAMILHDHWDYCCGTYAVW